MLSYKAIGKHIRAARLRLDLKQEDVAEATSISLAYYGKIERGDVHPTLERLAEIAIVLQMPFDGLFKGAVLSGTTTENAADEDEVFVRFFSEMGHRHDTKTKNVMMAVCQQIDRLTEESK